MEKKTWPKRPNKTGAIFGTNTKKVEVNGQKTRLMNQCTEPFFFWFSSLTASQGLDYDQLTPCRLSRPFLEMKHQPTITSGIDSNMFLGSPLSSFILDVSQGSFLKNITSFNYQPRGITLKTAPRIGCQDASSTGEETWTVLIILLWVMIFFCSLQNRLDLWMLIHHSYFNDFWPSPRTFKSFLARPLQ